MIHINNLSKRFGLKNALKDVNYRFPDSGIIALVGVNGAGTGWGIETSSTVFNLSKGNSGTVTAIGYNTGQWYNIVYVGQNLTANSLTVSLYINGSLQHSGTDTSINTTDSTLKLGTNNSGLLSFNGRISQARVYNKALSADEIKKNYDGGDKLSMVERSVALKLRLVRKLALKSQFVEEISSFALILTPLCLHSLAHAPS